MGKFEIAAIVGGIAILFFFSQLELESPGPVSGRQAESTRRPYVDDRSIDERTQGGGISAGSSDGDVEIYGQQVKQVFDAVSLRAIDGDSLEAILADGTSREIRLASIDAPERNQTSGQAAQVHLATIVRGQAARIYQTDTDRYKRIVAFVLTGTTGTDVNATMVADGFAWHAIAFSDDPSLAELERQAKAAQRGLWSQRSPIPPWVHRK